MPHHFRAAPALGLAALTGAGLAAAPAGAQDAATPNQPTVTTPAAPGTPTPAPGVPATTGTTPTPSSPAPAPPAPKQTPVAPAPLISVSGEIDGYYQYQFTNPKNADRITGRIYAFRHNSPTVRLAWMDVYHTAQPGGFGFKVSLATGDAADADVPGGTSGSTTGEARYKNLAQFYGTYADRSGLTVDVGKYLSPYGYDTTEANLNYNYTLTLATYLVPNYVFGARATYPFKTPNIAASVFVVNSLEEGKNLGVEDDGGNHDIILRLNYTTPNGKFNYIPAYGFGRAKLQGPTVKGNENLVLFDNWLTYHLTAATTLAGEYVYRKDSDHGGRYNLRGDGYGLYYRQQLTPRNAFALRYSALSEHTDDMGVSPTTSTSFRVDEGTGTFEQKVASNFTVRYEYRHDHSNNKKAFGFLHGDNAGPASDQDTALVAGIFTF